MMLSHNIQVNHPCPVPIVKLKSDGNNFYCKGCSKSVIDFRGKSIEEIRFACASGNVCGVFENQQLKNQGKYRGINLLFFKVLTVIAFFGFNVSPIKAQINNSRAIQHKKLARDVVNSMNKNDAKPVPEKETVSRKKLQLFHKRKKRKYTTIGCPSF